MKRSAIKVIPFFAFQFSDLVDLEDSPRGSQTHANKVMDRARGVFGTLGTKNIFRPKVLALVSHNGSWFVGASVAVSPYVRPLVLYTRILRFNWSLQKSVIYFKALEIESNEKWSSSAFFKKPYVEKKDPCRNCTKMFGKLPGFIPKNARASKESVSFLAACAEYTPVNLLLHETERSPDACAEYTPVNLLLHETKRSSDEEVVVQKVLESFHSKCLYLMKNFKKIADQCSEAWEEKDAVQVREIYEKQVKERVHIFGVKPECNDSLLDLASTG